VLACGTQPLVDGGAAAFPGPSSVTRSQDGTETRQRAARSGTGGPYLRRLARTTPVQPSDEIRALWVVRDALRTPEDIDRCVDFAAQARFHILFVQVRGRADAYYGSKLEPPAPDLRYSLRDFDPLLYTITRARAAGIEVHAWINVYYAWSNGDVVPPEGHVVRSHPEWLVTDSRGVRADERPVDEWKAAGIEGYFLSPFSAGARDHIVSVVADLIDRYDVDGIHLDYVRFPGAEYGFGLDARTRFALEWGFDPVQVHSDSSGVSAVVGASGAAALDSLWSARRVQQVDSLVVAIRAATGDLPLSAAVVPDPEVARKDKGQDWINWVHNRWVDFVVPMAYNYRPADLLGWAQYLHNAIGRERMLVGLAVYGGRDAYLDRSVNILRVDGVEGFSIFSYNVLAQRRFAVQFIEQVFFAGGQVEGPEEPAGQEEGQDVENDVEEP
jgi:uncharacterized lipoprotein YddW (UPF0748 family)